MPKEERKKYYRIVLSTNYCKREEDRAKILKINRRRPGYLHTHIS